MGRVAGQVGRNEGREGGRRREGKRAKVSEHTQETNYSIIVHNSLCIRFFTWRRETLHQTNSHYFLPLLF